jgi:hypothetical protein
VTIAAELGQVSGFGGARQLMGYCVAVPSEDSSGKRVRRGGITKAGNPHLRRIVGEAAWSYRRPLCIWYGLRRRQESISEEAKEIAWKAQHRLHKRYMKLGAAGKAQGKIITAVARELDVLQLSRLLGGDVKESRNGNPTRELQMATDRTRIHTLCGAVVSSLFSFAARC